MYNMVAINFPASAFPAYSVPLSPTELVPPNTLHTDRPYISSSTWVQAAPACSGVVSPYTVIVRYANWRPRGWPCPAGVGGDPPSFPQCMHVPGAAAAACAAWGRSESTSPATQSPRFIAAATSPYVLPSIPSLTCRPAHLSDDAALACRVARLHPRPHIHVRAEPERRGSCSQSAIAPRGIREIQASRRSGSREKGYSHPVNTFLCAPLS